MEEMESMYNTFLAHLTRNVQPYLQLNFSKLRKFLCKINLICLSVTLKIMDYSILYGMINILYLLSCSFLGQHILQNRNGGDVVTFENGLTSTVNTMQLKKECLSISIQYTPLET